MDEKKEVKKEIKTEVKKPDSLIVAGAQSELWRVIQKYNFPLYLWELIAKSLHLEIKEMYRDQLGTDQADYDQKRKESEAQKEASNKSDSVT